MNCAQLERALRILSESRGYSFHSLPSARIAEVTHLPAAVLEPPTVASVEAKRHGRISYEVTLHLLCPAARASASQRSEYLERMESELLEIFTQLSDDECVIAIEDLGMTPREYAFTAHGEISQTARAKVVTFF